jgi:hypothetical protein
VREPEAGGEDRWVGAADKSEASTRSESARYRVNQEVLVSADEVPEGSKTDGKGESARERKVARVGTHEMDWRVTGRLRNAPSSLRKHPGAKIDTDNLAPAAPPESSNSCSGPAADIERIIDRSDNRQGALDQRVGGREWREFEFGSEEIVASLRRGEYLSRQFEEGRATGMKHPPPDLSEFFGYGVKGLGGFS